MKPAPATALARRHTHYEPGRAPEHSLTALPLLDDDNALVTMAVDRGTEDIPDLLPPDNDSDNEEEDLRLQALVLGESPLALVPTVVPRKARSQAVSYTHCIV